MKILVFKEDGDYKIVPKATVIPSVGDSVAIFGVPFLKVIGVAYWPDDQYFTDGGVLEKDIEVIVCVE